MCLNHFSSKPLQDLSEETMLKIISTVKVPEFRPSNKVSMMFTLKKKQIHQQGLTSPTTSFIDADQNQIQIKMYFGETRTWHRGLL